MPGRRLHAERGLTMEDALILLTYLGELSLPLVGRWGQMVVHVCSSFPKEEMAAALENYRGGSRSASRKVFSRCVFTPVALCVRM